jgi:microcompartment protein CcmL/EutN
LGVGLGWKLLGETESGSALVVIHRFGEVAEVRQAAEPGTRVAEAGE